MTVADAAAALPPGAVQRPVCRVLAGVERAALDWVAEEVPVALEYNGIAHAVMLASPLDLEDFALGFSLAEGILAQPAELYGVDVVASALGITLQLEVASAAFVRLKDRRRSLAGRTGCGLCGTENLAQVRRSPMRNAAVTGSGAGAQPSAAAVTRAFAQFEAHQALQRVTGAVHAAAWCSRDGELRLLREDVGRHNALDKLVGALTRTEIRVASGFFAVTSRASFEMVQKTAAAGGRLLAAVSAPTALAIETAEAAGVALVGFARRDGCVVYAGRLGPPDADTRE